MSQAYDVIVVGAGPAGATAAYFLSQAGKRVLVLEKQALPRYKACGGAISAGVLAQFPFSFESVVQCRARAISYALGQQAVTIPLETPSLLMVMRPDFDAHILRHAHAEVRQGVAVHTVREKEDTVIVETSAGERIEAAFLVAADGANSVVARSLNLRRRKVLAGAIEVETSVPGETLARFREKPLLIFGEIAVGYLWIFPKSDHLSVGIGALGARPGELQSVLERVMARFGIDIQGQLRRGHPIPIFSRPEPVGTARSLLVGDAAGLVDPFTGEGIRFAIKSGRLAAEAILAHEPERYTASVARQIGRNHALGAALTPVFYRLPRASFDLALRNPALSRGLMEMVADRIGYGRLLLRIWGSLPAYAFTRKPGLQTLSAR